MIATVLDHPTCAVPSRRRPYRPVTSDYRDAVQRVLDCIQADPADQHTVDSMAATARYSKFHFSRVFTAVIGVSPGTFLKDLRLKLAMDLLEQDTMSVTEITIKVGYTSIGTFSSRFSADVGLSPSAYRALAWAVSNAPQPHAMTGTNEWALDERRWDLKPGERLLLEALRATDCVWLDTETGLTAITRSRLGDDAPAYRSKTCDATVRRLAAPQIGLAKLDDDGIHWRLTSTGYAALDAHLTAAAPTSSLA